MKVGFFVSEDTDRTSFKQIKSDFSRIVRDILGKQNLNLLCPCNTATGEVLKYIMSDSNSLHVSVKNANRKKFGATAVWERNKAIVKESDVCLFIGPSESSDEVFNSSIEYCVDSDIVCYNITC